MGLQELGHENVLVCPTGSAIGQAARGQGLRVIEMPMKGDADLFMVHRLRKTFRDENPDVVHLHSRRGADVFGGLAAKWANVPSVVSRRVDNPESRLWTSLKYSLFNHVITISEGIREVLLSQGMEGSSVSCVRSSVVAEEYQKPSPIDSFHREFGLPKDAWVIGVVAQLIERKGHRFLLELLPELIAQYPSLRVIFFGKGPEEDALKAKVEELGLSNVVVFAGFRTDMPNWLGRLNLLVHPALMEGLGISLLQASAAGVPIIGGRAGGIPEVIVDGETGLLVEPGDLESLRKALSQLVMNDGLCWQMGKAGRQRVEQFFSVDVMVEGNQRVYETILSS